MINLRLSDTEHILLIKYSYEPEVCQTLVCMMVEEQTETGRSFLKVTIEDPENRTINHCIRSAGGMGRDHGSRTTRFLQF